MKGEILRVSAPSPRCTGDSPLPLIEKKYGGGGGQKKITQRKMKLDLNLYILHCVHREQLEFPKYIKQLRSNKNKFANGIFRFCRNFDALNTFEIFRRTE